MVFRYKDKNGQIAIKGTCGPMGRSVEDCVRLLDVWWKDGMFNEDCFIPPIPFDADVYINGPSSCLRSSSSSKIPNLGGMDDEVKESGGDGGRRALRVGYFDTDNFFEPCKFLFHFFYSLFPLFIEIILIK